MSCTLDCKKCLLSKEIDEPSAMVSRILMISLASSDNRNEDVVELIRSLSTLINQYESTNDVVISALGFLLYKFTSDVARGLSSNNCKFVNNFLESGRAI